MLGFQDTVDKLARANGVSWYGHVLRKDDNDVLRKGCWSVGFQSTWMTRKRTTKKNMWKRESGKYVLVSVKTTL